MKNVLFYGNCQLFAIKEILNLPIKKFNISYVECFTTNISELDFKKLIIKSDIIICNPIQTKYREKNYLGTEFILKNVKIHCAIIIIESCYFNGYYPDLSYHSINNQLLKEPIDYHYKTMISYYKNGKSEEEFINEVVENENFYNKEYLEDNVNKSLNELKIRCDNNKKKFLQQRNVFILSIWEFIKDNYKNKLLFYSMNHPTNILLQFIVEQIFKIMNIRNLKREFRLEIDPLNNPKCLIYKGIQKIVNFDLNKHEPLMKNKSNLREITKLYFETYNKVNL